MMQVSLTGSNVEDDQALPLKVVRGNLLKVPFRSGHYGVENSGATVSFQVTGITDNGDGTGTGIYVNVPAGINYGARIRFPFYGRVFGVRWKREGSPPPNDFSVAIDGVPYGPIPAGHSYLVNESVSIPDGESLYVAADDLTDGVHYAEIAITSIASSSSIITLYGILVEERAGYSEKPRAHSVIGTNAVPTTSTAIPVGTGSTQARTVRKIIFVNTGAASITVTITNSGTTMWQKAIAAGDSADFDFGERTSISGVFAYSASAAGVNASVIGGY